ncbi:nuclear transport factor 2 family protein [Bdellovibrio svalbardensis]|uniref:Nuclear transport factor 2 family protein n=1 Tax=Bdellovibrio svalbardensis TaxID=2972972 RepID=A0ABT6DMJ4_9BACT|nr:nuclear transport factor 2 family protein [Bdellovibrio svalbardensis]MDG0817727.1 nuclear transport factor 2 family protein [Bdellovibrio svalbardensis]
MTLLSANDRFEILDLCSRYNRCLDNADEEGVMDCWARSGITFESPGGKFTNWEQLRKHLGKELHGGSLSGKRMVMFNMVVSDGGSIDHAIVDSEYLVINTSDHQIIETGSFKQDKVTRTSMGWRFQNRVQKADVVAQTRPIHRPAEVHPS